MMCMHTNGSEMCYFHTIVINLKILTWENACPSLNSEVLDRLIMQCSVLFWNRKMVMTADLSWALHLCNEYCYKGLGTLKNHWQLKQFLLHPQVQVNALPYWDWDITRNAADFSGPQLIWDRLSQSGKTYCGLTTSPHFILFLEITDVVSSGLKREKTTQIVISTKFKSQQLWSCLCWVHGMDMLSGANMF